MQVRLVGAIITEANESRKNPGTVYMEIKDREGTYNFAMDNAPMEEINKNLLQPVIIDAQVSGRLFAIKDSYQERQTLTFEKVQITPMIDPSVYSKAMTNGTPKPEKATT